MLFLKVSRFFSYIHDQVNYFRCNFNVNPSSFSFLFPSYFLNLSLLSLMPYRSFLLHSFSSIFHLIFYLSSLYKLLLVYILGFLNFILKRNLMALLLSPSSIGVLLFLLLVRQKLLDKQLFLFLSVKCFLDFDLINLEFSVSPLSFLSRKLIVILSFLDLVHCGSI